MLIKILIPSTSLGLLKDAYIVKNIIDKKYNVIVCNFSDKINQHKNSDVNIYFERFPQNTSFGDKHFLTDTSKINMLFVNHDLFTAFKPDLNQFYSNMNFFLTKTKSGTKYMENIIKKYNYAGRIVYVGFDTPINVENILSGNSNFNYNVLHNGGKSGMKNTDIVMDMIDKYKKELTTKFPGKIIVTCREGCLKRKYMEKYAKYVPSSPQIKLIFDRFLPDTEMNVIIKNTFIHLCPSYIEGFGHYINEARKYGKLVVTIDAPPMNEFVTKHGYDGFLIKSGSKYTKENSAIGYVPDVDDMYRVLIEIATKYTKKQLLQIAKRGQLKAKKDTIAFEKQFSLLMKMISAKFL
jgi:glycosyltransferase involved in cell wall biosynthesis